MNLISELFTNPYVFFIIVTGLVISITIHEFAHAYVAYKLGDDTPYLQGRVTLNPLSHLDPIGSLLILLVGFGWGKPVEYDAYNLKYPKRDSGLISIAGPISNILLGIIFIVLQNVFDFAPFQFVAYINFFLAFFNLIPIHPLDGYNVVLSLLPYEAAYRWRELERFSLILLLVVVFSGITSIIISPIVSVLMVVVDNLVKIFI